MTQWTRRELLSRSAAAAAALASGGAGAWSSRAAAQTAAPAGPARRPNILLVMADDMGFSDAGCYGGEVATPTLDGLAKGGIRFTQCYSTARCWPSRTCVLTGYYAQQVRADPRRGGVPAWAPLLAERLKEAGYRSYHSGKWHVIGAQPNPGGFERSLAAEDHDHFFNPGGLILDGKPLAGKRAKPGPAEGSAAPAAPAQPPAPDARPPYLTTVIADYGLRFLQEHARDHKDTPFFLYLAFTCPHFPLHAIKEDIEKYKDRYAEGWDSIRRKRHQRLREMGIVNCDLSDLDEQVAPGWNLKEEQLQQRIGPGEAGRAVPWDRLTAEQKAFQARKMAIHAAMVDRMDQEIARMVEQLKAMGQWENTIIIFLSDNGASAEQIIRGSGHNPSAEPGSAGSYLCLGPGWSSAANSPFRLHKSWVHEGGISSPCIVHWPAGISAGGQLRHTPCHFVDIVPTLLDLSGLKADPRPGGPSLAGRSLRPAFAEDRPLPFDYLFFHHMDNRAIRVGDWKLVDRDKLNKWELYDLKTDRCEKNNLAPQQPQKVQELAALWEKCEKEFNAAAPTLGQGPKPPGKKKQEKSEK